jgi:aminopeptidase N
MKYISLLFMAAIVSLSTNARTKNGTVSDSVKQVTLDTLSVTAPTGPMVYRAAATRVWEIQNTHIALEFNWKEKTASAREWLKLHPFFYATDTLVLDAKGMRIDSAVMVTKKGNIALNYTYADNQLKIRFSKWYEAKDSIELYFKYTAMPYATVSGGSGAITDDRGLYFINTDYSVPHKPAEIWTQGETESNSHWMITIDKPNTRFTTQVELTVPDSFVTLSNGALIKTVKKLNGYHTDLWKMDMPIQAYAVMFAIGKYSIIKDKWRNKEVNYYVEPQYAPYARLMFRNTPEMIEYFSKRTGVLYPWNKYDQVVVRDYVSGAMENTTAALFGEFMNQNAREIADHNNEDIVSHELFHEWFGDYVTCQSWSNLTVNESFANYGEQLWRAHKYGKDEGDELAWNDLQGYIGSAMVNDPQLVRFYYDSREDMFDAVSYNKGGAILRYLNNLMGDQGFDRAMNIYLTKNALHSATAENWKLAVNEATGSDWSWFFNEWYYHAGHPVIKVVYNYNDTTQKLTVSVSQNQDDSTFMFQLPLKTALINGNDISVIDWNITRRRDTFIYAYQHGQRPVIIADYSHVLPGEVRDGKKPAQWLVAYKASTDYITHRIALSAAGKLLSDTSSQALIELGLHDKLASVRRHALIQLENAANEKYHKKWMSEVMAMAATDTDRLVRAEAYDVLGEWKIKQAMPAMEAAIADSSYAVAGAALNGLGKIDKDTAYVYAKRMAGTDPQGTLENAIFTAIAKEGADDDVAVFEAKAPYVQGTKVFSFAMALGSYLKNVKSNVSFDKTVDIYTTVVLSQNMKQFRAAITGFLFQAATEQKEIAKGDDKDTAANGQKRLGYLKTALQKVVTAESDPETRKDDESKMKDIFQ